MTHQLLLLQNHLSFLPVASILYKRLTAPSHSIMHLVMYSSDYVGTLKDMPSDFADILKKARMENPKYGITGVLLYDNGKFLQILEGEKDKLDTLLKNIQKDPRHKNYDLLISAPIQSRELESWNMEAFDITNINDKDWGLLKDFRDAYLANYKVSANQLISWVRHFIKEHDKIKDRQQ